MNEQQIQEIVDRVVAALEGLKPLSPASKEWWKILAAFGPWAALLAAGVAFWIGKRSLDHQKEVLEAQKTANETTLDQKREADARAEWWRRTQWALEAAADQDNDVMSSYGTKMLTVLAKSELAGEKDLELLDAAWRETSTGLQPEGIKQLIQDAQQQAQLTPKQQTTLSTYEIVRQRLQDIIERQRTVDDNPMTSDNEDNDGGKGDS